MTMPDQSKHQTIENDIKRQLAQLSGTNAEDWWLVSRVRHGLEVALTTVKGHSGDGEVITQPFTCVTAINPIIASGMQPRYVDITLDTLSLDTAKVASHLHDQTRAIIMQHSFSMPADIAGIRHMLKKDSALQPLVIEDSAHCLGFIARDESGIVADVSVHSFGAEKMLPTRYGAAVWINPVMLDKQLRSALCAAFDAIPSARPQVAVRVMLYPFFNAGLNRLPGGLSAPLRTILLRTTLLRSPIVPQELRGINYESCQSLNTRQLKQIARAMDGYANNYNHRAAITQIYRDTLDASVIPLALRHTNYACVRFPLLAKNGSEAEQWFTMLRTKGYFAGKWYRPLFFPGVDHTIYQYAQGSCSVAEVAAERIVNLPTGHLITVTIAKEIADALNRTRV